MDNNVQSVAVAQTHQNSDSVTVREEISSKSEFKKGFSNYMGKVTGSALTTGVFILIVVILACSCCYVTSLMLPESQPSSTQGSQ